MDKSVSWKGNRFWQDHDREGHIERLQVLAQKTIFPSRLDASTISTARRGDIIPIPDLSIGERLAMSQRNEILESEVKIYSHSALKLDVESLRIASSGSPTSPPMSPIDVCIAELEASIVAERASRLPASPKILSKLRPGLVQRVSSLVTKSGISRVPREIARKIVGFIEFRRDLAIFSQVSKAWRDETLPLLYSTLVLRGWDQILSCLSVVRSNKHIANLIVDLTLGECPPSKRRKVI